MEQKYFLFFHSLRSFGGGILRVDTLMRIVGEFETHQAIFRLGERYGAVWPISDTFWGLPTPQPLVRFDGITTMGVFGKTREVMHFSFGGLAPGYPGDTLWGYVAMLAKGIGVVQEQYYETEHYNLQGAIIDGVQYGTIVSVDETQPSIPSQIALHQNYPNPFNPITHINYSIPKVSHVSLKVFDMLGREVKTLFDGIQNKGQHTAIFHASTLASGMYIAALQTKETKLARRMLLIK